MPRIARIVIPNIPHHVTQRGNRRQPVFFCDQDYIDYLCYLSDWCKREGVEIWSYCLMPNHVHLIAVPSTEQSLSRAIGETHRRYTRQINTRQGWTGYLWQGRFSSFPMDDRHLLAAVRYIELNPVRANLVANAQDYPWSSIHAHLNGQDDNYIKVKPLVDRVENWRAFIKEQEREEVIELFRKHERTGRPVGGESFIKKISNICGRDLRPKRAGPKPR